MNARPSLTRWLRMFALLLVWSELLAARRADAQQAALWEFAPYKVRVIVAAAEIAPGDSRVLEDLATQLDSFAAADWGAGGEVSVESATSAAASHYWHRLDDPPTSDWLPSADSGVDKLVIVAIHGDTLRVRELDTRLQQWSPLVQRSVGQREWLAAQAWRAINESFQSLALIDDVDGKNVRLRLRAANLIDEGSTLKTIQVDDVLRPIIRAESRSGKSLIAPVEWTLLQVTDVSSSSITAHWYSGYRSPLSGRNRGQMKTFALITRPRYAATTLTLASNAGGAPLRGYDVYAQRPESEVNYLLGTTDVRGEVQVPAGALRLVQLTIKHGDEILARVPITPGFDRTVRLEMPDDRARLEAEGLTIGLQEQVVDLVVRRQTLIAEAQNDLTNGRFDEAEKRVKRLQQMPRIEPLQAELRNQRLRLQSSDALVRAKIERLFKDTELVLNTYFDAKELDQLECEVIYKRKAK